MHINSDNHVHIIFFSFDFLLFRPSIEIDGLTHVLLIGNIQRGLLSDPLALDKKKVKRIAECQLILHPAALKYVHTFSE
jgi:hypothetical protein